MVNDEDNLSLKEKIAGLSLAFLATNMVLNDAQDFADYQEAIASQMSVDKFQEQRTDTALASAKGVICEDVPLSNVVLDCSDVVDASTLDNG